jgi:hypothetical protein
MRQMRVLETALDVNPAEDLTDFKFCSGSQMLRYERANLSVLDDERFQGPKCRRRL